MLCTNIWDSYKTTFFYDMEMDLQNTQIQDTMAMDISEMSWEYIKENY